MEIKYWLLALCVASNHNNKENERVANNRLPNTDILTGISNDGG
jgi:hypothetical protein